MEFDRLCYRDYLRPHLPHERQALEQSIAANGCRDPLVVGLLDGKKYLIDGFHRLEVCSRLQVAYQTVEYPFTSEAEILTWIERNAEGKRSQTRTERNYYLGCRYLREKKSNGRPLKETGKKVASFDSTAELIASEAGCSHQHVKNCAKLAETIEELCAEGWGFLKWPLLTEQIKYNAALLLALPGRSNQAEIAEQIKGSLASGEKITAKKLKEVLGEEDSVTEPPQIDYFADLSDAILKAGDHAANDPSKLSTMVLKLRMFLNLYEKKLTQVQA